MMVFRMVSPGAFTVRVPLIWTLNVFWPPVQVRALALRVTLLITAQATEAAPVASAEVVLGPP